MNGAFAARHKGGYTAFNVDITPFVKFDGTENVIAVMVNNMPAPFIPPLDIGYTIYGGLYRNVHFITTEKCHFSMNDYGSSGVYVTMPNLEFQPPSFFKVKVKVSNEQLKARKLTIANKLFDANNNIVAKFNYETSINGNQESDFQIGCQFIFTSLIQMWSPEDPYLYRLETKIGRAHV